MSKISRNYVEPTEEEIARFAYYLWESEGRQHGRDLDYWLQAKKHLTVDRQFEAGILEGMELKKHRKVLPIPEESFAPSPNSESRPVRRKPQPSKTNDVAEPQREAVLV